MLLTEEEREALQAAQNVIELNKRKVVCRRESLDGLLKDPAVFDALARWNYEAIAKGSPKTVKLLLSALLKRADHNIRSEREI